MKEKAYAKVNLSLDVSSIRDDGYHELHSIMVPVDFYDELNINIADHDNFVCNDNLLLENNSIIKMINRVKKQFKINDHFNINLKKRIPMEAGLGGGTSDAAATLRILKKIYNLDLSEEDIKEICLSVGADVLFSYYNIPSVVKGVGEQLRFIEIDNDYYILLVKPNSGVSTRECFNLLDINSCIHPDINKLEEALINGDNIDNLLGNSLFEPAIKLNSEINDIFEQLKTNGARNIMMTGSGSTLFCIDSDYKALERLNDRIKKHNYFSCLTKILR